MFVPKLLAEILIPWIQPLTCGDLWSLNPRPNGVFPDPARRWGRLPPPPRHLLSAEQLRRFSIRRRHLIAPSLNFPNMFHNFIWTSLMASRVGWNVIFLFFCPCWLRPGKADISNWNKADWTTWIVSGTLVSTILSLVSNQGHPTPQGQKRTDFKCWVWVVWNIFLGQILVKNVKKKLFQRPKSGKIGNRKKCRNSRK